MLALCGSLSLGSSLISLFAVEVLQRFDSGSATAQFLFRSDSNTPFIVVIAVGLKQVSENANDKKQTSLYAQIF